jgi:ParB family chromosome partitioning protein
MSKEPIKKAAARPKAQLGGAALGNLMAAAGSDTRGDPIRIPLADIDEDPDQPRQTFDQAELESMAESIRDLGVIQAIVVKPPQAGRYMLVAGARRYRASKLAGMKDIPAIVRAATEGNFAAQVVENTQRANLTNSELAEAVARFVEEGRTSKQIAAICNLKDYQVAAFRKVADFPPQLRERINAADMRALYDLYRVWEKGAEQITQALEAFDAANPGATLTITEARRISSSITGKPTGSIVLDRAPANAAPTPAPAPAPVPAPAPAEVPAQASAQVETPTPQVRDDAQTDQGSAPTIKPAPAAAISESTNRAPIEKPADMQAPPIASPAPAPKSAGPVFIVSVGGGAEGRLIVDRRAEKPGRALVELGGTIEEVDPTEIGLIRIE